jgi:TfoX/Sxy family transcriptional regulator of competence genes
MSADQSLIDWIVEAEKPLGTVTHHAMMGVATLYCNGAQVQALLVRIEVLAES